MHPDVSRRQEAYAAEGVDFLDAPVFGSQPEAEAGGLWIVVGGDRAAYDRAASIFRPLSVSTRFEVPPNSQNPKILLGSH